MTNITPEESYNFVVNLGLKRHKRSENIIMTDPRWSFRYARYIIEGRFLEAESVIMKDPRWAYWYAYYIIKGRWIEAEPVIMKDPYWWNMYNTIL
jgi:hypothetical protein